MSNIEALRAAAENALDVLDEARSYTGSESWSPSMTEECERAMRLLRAALAQPAASGEPADHVPAGPEAEAATDAALGLVLLPPIRVDRATHAALQESARARGLIVQAIVRERLDPHALPAATAQPAPMRRMVKSTEQNQANANLIAAAPDLLHALQVILTRWDGCDEDDTPPAVVEARKAVARAVGAA